MGHIVVSKVAVGDPPPLESVIASDAKITHIQADSSHMYVVMGGMNSGKSTAMIHMEIDDGEHVIIEFPLAILNVAMVTAKAMAATWGEHLP